MNRREMIWKIIENADDEVLRDYSYSYLDTFDDKTLKEEVDKIE